MINNLSAVTKEETYFTKALPNEAVRILAFTVETYRKLVKHL